MGVNWITMRLLVEADIWKVSSTAISVLAIEIGIKAVRSAVSPSSIFIHQLPKPQDTMSLIAENKIANVAQVCY